MPIFRSLRDRLRLLPKHDSHSTSGGAGNRAVHDAADAGPAAADIGVQPVLEDDDEDELDVDSYEPTKHDPRDAPSITTRKLRSVNDYGSAQELRNALLQGGDQDEGTSSGCFTTTNCNNSDATAWLFSKNERVLREILQKQGPDQPKPATTASFPSSSSTTPTRTKTWPQQQQQQHVDTPTSTTSDWVLQNYDQAHSHPQTVDREQCRLLVLKSFFILDQDNRTTQTQQQQLDAITKNVQTMFQTNLCLISLVDLGRQWFLSKQGLDEACHESPRNLSFCTHGILSTLDMFEVCHASQDVRFQTNPLVVQEAIQYYAGAPLKSPQGYKLGMLCVADDQPRKPMSVEQRRFLKDMAQQVVDVLVEHRHKMSVWFNNLVATQYPAAEEAMATCRGQTKEEEEATTDHDHDDDDEEDDTEFAAFLRATHDMSWEQVTDLLQKQAATTEPQSGSTPTQSPPPPPMDQTSPRQLSPRPRPQRRRRRHVHFAHHHDAMEQIYSVPSYKQYKDHIWFNADELYEFRNDAKDIVREFRTKRPEYIQTMLRLFQLPRRPVEDIIMVEDNDMDDDDDDFKDHPTNHRSSSTQAHRLLRRLLVANADGARGLESSMVDVLGHHRRATRHAVLKEQLFLHGEEYRDTMDGLRDQSLLHSGASTRFAAQLAHLDRMEALWSAVRPEVPRAA